MAQVKGFLAVLLLYEFIHRPRVLQPKSPARLPRVQESLAAYWEEAHALPAKYTDKNYHPAVHENQRMLYCRHKTSSDSSRAHNKGICITFGLHFTSCPPNCCFHRPGNQAAHCYFTSCDVRRTHEEFQLCLADSESLQEQATLPASAL
uniref:Apolipoprotein C-II n=1 Tax=Anser brachyrhynchus TaxID=132585 RepID=A0A8B9CW60_9AVES